MNIQLYINDKLVDLDNNVIIPITYQAYDVQSFFSKSTNYSKEFNVPDTINNREIFEFSFNINNIVISELSNSANTILSNSRWITDNVPCEIYNEFKLVFKGVVSFINMITKGNEKYYTLKLLGKTKNLFNDIQDLYLTDLSWDIDKYNHIFNDSVIYNSDYNSDTKPFFYCMTDHGEFIDKTTDFKTRIDAMNTEELNQFYKPAVFVKSIIDKIFEENGYTYESDIIGTDMFKNLCIPFSNKSIIAREPGLLVTSIDSSGLTGIAKPLSPLTIGFPVTDIKTDVYNNWTGGIDGQVYKINEGGSSNISIRWRHACNDAPLASTFCSLELFVRRSGVNTSLMVFPFRNDDVYYTDSTGAMENITFNEGDEIYFMVNVQYTGYPDFEVYINQFDFTLTNNDSTTLSINQNQEINPSDYIIKDITQRDFLISVFKMFNIFVDLDDFDNKKYNLYTRDYYYNQGKSLDWTNKLIRDNQVNINIKPIDVGYLDFKYKEDNDYHNTYIENLNGKSYGEDIITTNRISDKGDFIELIFSPTPYIDNTDDFTFTNTMMTVDEKYYPISKIGWKSVDGSDGKDINVTLKKINYKSPPRILLKHTVQNLLTKGDYSTGLPFDYTGDKGGQDLTFRREFNTYIGTGVTSVLENTGNTLKSYYENYLNNTINQYSRILTGYFYLDPVDIQEFNLNDKVFINFGEDIGSGWFIFNKIIDYIPGKTETKVELLKLNDTNGINIDYTPMTAINLWLIFGGEDIVKITDILIYPGEDTVATGATIIDDGGRDTIGNEYPVGGSNILSYGNISYYKFEKNVNDENSILALSPTPNITTYQTGKKDFGLSVSTQLTRTYSSGEKSISWWENVQNGGQLNYFTGANFGLYVNLTGGGKFYFQQLYVSGSVYFIDITQNTAADRLSLGWHHITMTDDGTNIRWYINGDLRLTTTTRPDAYINLQIRPTTNIVDELSIWSRVLTDYESGQLYNQGVGLFYDEFNNF